MDEDVNQQIVISGAQDSPDAKTGSKQLYDCKFQTMLKIPLAMADAFWENRLTAKRENMFLRSQNEADRSSERVYPAALVALDLQSFESREKVFADVVSSKANSLSDAQRNSS